MGQIYYVKYVQIPSKDEDQGGLKIDDWIEQRELKELIDL